MDPQLEEVIRCAIPENERNDEKISAVELTKNTVDLMTSCMNGDLSAVKRLIREKGVSPNETDGNFRTPLHFAAHSRSTDVVVFLLSQKADPNEQDFEGNTATLISASLNDMDTTRLLLSRGGDIHLKNKRGVSTAFHIAGHGHITLLQDIISNSKDEDIEKFRECGESGSILHFSCSAPQNSVKCCLLLLKEVEVDPNLGDGCGAMPLHIAAACKNVDVARVLLENGANVNARMQAGVTALHIAADNCDLEFVRLVCAKGAILYKDGNNSLPSSSSKEITEMISSMSIGEETQEEIKRRVDPLVDKYRLSGNKAFKIGDLSLAVTMYSRGLDEDNKNHILLSNRSAAYFNMEEYDKSLNDAKLCVEVEPKYIKGYYRVAVALTSLGRKDEAIEALRDGIKIVGENDSLKDSLEKLEK